MLGLSAPLSIAPAVGQVLYATTLARRPTLIGEYGTSLGCSTIYLASALRDLGARSIVMTELLPEKVQPAAENLADAGVDDLVEIRVGDGLATSIDLHADVVLLFLDGSNDLTGRARSPRAALAPHALVIADMSHDEPHHARYREHVTDPARGCLSTELPLDAGLVISSRTASTRELIPSPCELRRPRAGRGNDYRKLIQPATPSGCGALLPCRARRSCTAPIYAS